MFSVSFASNYFLFCESNLFLKILNPRVKTLCSISGGLEFQPGSSYYFFSPSSRTKPSPPPASQSATSSSPASQSAVDPCRSSLRLAIQVGAGGTLSSSESPAGVRVNIPRSLDYAEYSSDRSAASRENRETSGGSGLTLPAANSSRTTNTTSSAASNRRTVNGAGGRKAEGAGHLTSSGRVPASTSDGGLKFLVVLVLMYRAQ